jgi:hypothetical protein
MFAPDAERGLAAQPALDDLQWDEFVVTVFQTRLGAS